MERYGDCRIGERYPMVSKIIMYSEKGLIFSMLHDDNLAWVNGIEPNPDNLSRNVAGVSAMSGLPLSDADWHLMPSWLDELNHVYGIRFTLLEEDILIASPLGGPEREIVLFDSIDGIHRTLTCTIRGAQPRWGKGGVIVWDYTIEASPDEIARLEEEIAHTKSQSRPEIKHDDSPDAIAKLEHSRYILEQTSKTVGKNGQGELFA